MPMLQSNLQQKIATELGVGSLPPESQRRIIARLGEIILQRATMNILDVLPQEKRGEFGKLAAGEDQGAVEMFLKAHVPNAEELVNAAIRQEVEAFKGFKAQLAAN
ncbi:MAG: hypothetical protein HY455_01080 [Parcubacteria group bacterium]|nr:hypothetical protein [Parcubacteria group bacterium]